LKRPTHGGNLSWAAEIAHCSPHALLDFSASINPLGMPESAIAILSQAANTLISYPDPNYADLKATIAAHHNIDPDWVLPGNGAAELLTWACRELAELKQTYLLTPGFADYDRALAAFGARVKRLELQDFDQPLLSVPGLPLRLTAPTALKQQNGILLNNPHNPTGQWATAESVRSDLLDNPHYSLVVVDEAFMDFLPESHCESVIPWIQDYPKLVVVRSLTKFYAIPGLRLGYAIAHPDRLARWQEWRDPWSVNTLAAKVGEVVLHDRPFQAQTYHWLAEAKPMLVAGLKSIPGLQVYEGAVNFVLVRSAVSVTDLQVRLLKNHQVYIRDCISFAALGDRFFRVAVRTRVENERLVRALKMEMANGEGRARTHHESTHHD
jgi:L-threonine-O-3-phosphate decarboxylase